MKPRKAQVQQQPVDGAFPMMPSGASRSSRSIARSRVSSTSSYYKQYNDDDIPRPMCGQGAINKILAVSPGVKTRKSPALLTPSVDGSQKSYEKMPYDVTPMDNIYSSERSKFSQNFHDPEPSDAMIYIPQFNVNKAKQVQAKRQPKPPSHRRLPSVPESSREDSTQVSEDASAIISLSSSRVAEEIPKEKATAPAPAPIPPPRRMTSKDRRIEQMIRSMQDIIMQQEENLNALGSQNAQYRVNMTLFQEHVMNLRKEQVHQKNEIHKLHFEREAYEAEATSLREELKMMRSELAKTKSERSTSWSQNGGALSQKAVPWVKKEPATNNEAPWTKQKSSPSHQPTPWVDTDPTIEKEAPEAPWTKKKSSPRHQQPAPWVETDPTIEKDATGKPKGPRSPSEQRVPSYSKRQSVSFHEHNEFLAEYAQERDDAPSDMRWERSRQRSVFNKNAREINTAPVPSTVMMRPDETREASPRLSSPKLSSPRHDSPSRTSPRSHSPKASPSGKCSDLRELQLRANELRDTVAKMKLESPTNHEEQVRHQSPKSQASRGSNYSASPTSYDERKRDAVLRYSRGERGTSYWNSHDMMYKEDGGDDI